jgi:hypothetical protein
VQDFLDADAAADMLAWEKGGFSEDGCVRISLIDRDVPFSGGRSVSREVPTKKTFESWSLSHVTSDLNMRADAAAFSGVLAHSAHSGLAPLLAENCPSP